MQVSNEALKAIAYQAMERKTGARGLRAIMERILLDPMFEVPGSDVVEVIITEDAVHGRQPAEYIRQASDSTSTGDDEETSQPLRYQEVRNT